jgi:hypothetical protein
MHMHDQPEVDDITVLCHQPPPTTTPRRYAVTEPMALQPWPAAYSLGRQRTGVEAPFSVRQLRLDFPYLSQMIFIRKIYEIYASTGVGCARQRAQ